LDFNALRTRLYNLFGRPFKMVVFDHEKLDVYRLSMDFLVFADRVAHQLDGRRYYMANQLRRAAFSICLNIAEGAGEFSRPEKRRFYRLGRRSAVECAAILRCCERLKIQLPADTPANLETLARIIAMLTALTKMPARPTPSPSPSPSPSPKNTRARRPAG
jgi:four helix bundle protein